MRKLLITGKSITMKNRSIQYFEWVTQDGKESMSNEHKTD